MPVVNRVSTDGLEPPTAYCMHKAALPLSYVLSKECCHQDGCGIGTNPLFT